MPKRSDKIREQKVAKPSNPTTAKRYAFWYSLPIFYRKNAPKLIEELGFEIPEDLLDVLECRSKTEFAKKYKVSRNQLLRWEVSDFFKKDVKEFEKITNVKNLLKYINASFTRKVIKEADAPRVKLWHQLYAGYIEKEKHDHTGEIKTTVELTEEQKKELAKEVLKSMEK